MAASKRLIQLGSSLSAIQVGSMMNTPPLRRTSFNSYRLLSSSSSVYIGGQEFELARLQSEITSLKYEIREMRKEIREMRDHLGVGHKRFGDPYYTEDEPWCQARDLSDVTKRFISGANKYATEY